jgi:hypothetical protein
MKTKLFNVWFTPRANRMAIEIVFSKFRSVPHNRSTKVWILTGIHLICQIRMEVSYCTLFE